MNDTIFSVSLCVIACLGVCLLFPCTLVMVIVDISFIVSIVCILESIPQNDFSVPLVSNMLSHAETEITTCRSIYRKVK